MFAILSTSISIPLIIFLGVDALLLIGLIVYLAVRAGKKKAQAKETVEPVEEVVQPVEEVKQEQVEEVAKEEEVKEPIVEETVATEDVEVEVDSDEDESSDKDSAKRIPFAKKMLTLGDNALGYYDEIHNKFRSMRKINPRISVKGVSYRLGRQLVAKLTVRGKTLRLHLALDIEKYDQKVFFQKSMGDVKAYEEVPFTIKVRSDRGLRNAIKLINALAEEKGIESKTRYNQIDSTA